MNKLKMLFGLCCCVLLLTACQPIVQPNSTGNAAQEPTTLVVATHDSFNASDKVLAEFEQANHVKLQFLKLGDAGEALNKLALSKDAPLADVFYGVDNTFLSRALAANIFAPYESPALAQIPDEFKLDPKHSLLPVDVGYVNLNADKQWFAAKKIPLPQKLEDLTQPAYKNLLVVENPATSSPGLAFLLVTISYFGEDKYLDFWKGLRANGVLVTNGWEEAYNTHFTVGSGGSGDRPLVVSYTSSPPADVIFAKDGRKEPASVNFNPPKGVFRQIEFVGVLKGAKQPELAQKWVDFMLSKTFQEDMPLQMYVYPTVKDAALPELFTKFAEVPAEPAQVDPAAINANREKWIDAWTNAVLH
ncbi:MAG: thiamine ABC transporter substrate-binding protein [Caldilineaceae bacterium]